MSERCYSRKHNVEVTFISKSKKNRGIFAPFLPIVRVLLLHQHFKTPVSGGAIRSYYLAKALIDRQAEVIVITATNQKKAYSEVYEQITIHYLPIPYDNKYGFFQRIASFVRFMLASIAQSEKLGKIDYCYAISVPLTVGITAMWLKWRRGVPFIFEVGDLWPEAPIQMGFIKNYFLKQFLYWVEKKIYQSAYAIVGLSPAIQSSIQAIVPNKKVYNIPNFADCDFYQPIYSEGKQKLVVSYIGAIGLANGLDYLIECANSCRKASLPIQFVICGEGALRERLEINAKHLQLQNLTFIDFQDRAGVLKVMDATDVCFVSYKRLPVLETGSPNKFFDGLAAGKLIVTNFGGWIAREIEEARCGFSVDPNNPLDFVVKIKPFLADEKMLQQYQQAARALAERKFSRKILSEQFVNLFAWKKEK